MRRRSGAGGEPVKTRRHKTATLKRRNAPKAARHSSSSATHPETKGARLTRELQESLAREGATSEVLRVISSSPGDLKPVFNAMLENAVRLCEAELGHLFLYDGGAFHATALHSASQAYAEVRRRPVVLSELHHPDNPLARIARTKAVVHIADVRTEKSYVERVDPAFSEFVDLSGARTDLLVPMLKENELIGAFVIYRLEVLPFSMAMTAWAAKFFTSSICLSLNGRTSRR